MRDNRIYKKGEFKKGVILLSAKETILSTFFILFIIATPNSFADNTGAKIYYENDGAVGTIYTEESSGSGFVISNEGIIITNHHVISGNTHILIKISDKYYEINRVLYQDPELDIAVLKTREKLKKAVKLGSVNSIIAGEKIYVISSPLGYTNTFAPGEFKGVHPSGKVFLLLTQGVEHGSSGGAVFDRDGEVIGIIRSQIELPSITLVGGKIWDTKLSTAYKFAIPIDIVKDKILNKSIIDAEIKEKPRITIIIVYNFCDNCGRVVIINWSNVIEEDTHYCSYRYGGKVCIMKADVSYIKQENK